MNKSHISIISLAWLMSVAPAWTAGNGGDGPEDKTPKGLFHGDLDHGQTEMYFHVGLRMLSPYTLSADDEGVWSLSNDKTSTGGYIEWVWDRAFARDDECANKTCGGAMVRSLAFDPKTKPELQRWDLVARFSFQFGQDDEPSASAIVGSGEFGGELLVARHLMLVKFGEKSFGTLGAGGSFGFSTDRNARDIHHRIFGGLVANLAIKTGGGKALIRASAGWAEHDAVLMDPEDENRLRVLSRGGAPRYTRKSGPAFGAEFLLPMGETSHVTFGGRAYGDMDPNPWTLFVGYTIDLPTALKALMPGSGQEREEPGAQQDDGSK